MYSALSLPAACAGYRLVVCSSRRTSFLQQPSSEWNLLRYALPVVTGCHPLLDYGNTVVFVQYQEDVTAKTGKTHQPYGGFKSNQIVNEQMAKVPQTCYFVLKRTDDHILRSQGELRSYKSCCEICQVDLMDSPLATDEMRIFLLVPLNGTSLEVYCKRRTFVQRG